MKCIICKHGETRSGTITTTLQRENTTIIIKNVPAEVCDNCGEYYLNEAEASCISAIADAAVQNGSEVEIRKYAA